MLPKIDFVFTHIACGRYEGETVYSATVDTPVFMAQTELEMAGYEYLMFDHYEWPTHAWPGGYPIFYICRDGGMLCAKCANENIHLTSDKYAERDWRIVEMDVNYEDYLLCDHCGDQIESAYGTEAENEAPDSMDGDFDSAMASAGFGTDEDYGG